MREASFLRKPLTRVALAAALAAGACAGAAAADPPAKPNHEIKDPHYGDALFHYFQDHYFTSVTTLMASQHFGRVSHHDEEAEILRGGMLLSYGLTKESGQIFARLIQSTSPKVRDRAWFFLAKIRYQRGYLPEAENALAQVENNLPEGLQEERILLQANLLMAHGDYTAAADVLNGMSLKASSSRYARYNLGIALLKLDGTPRSIARGMAILDDVGRMPAENEEFRALRDRANVALGFTALGEGDPKTARGYLERVRLKSLQANKALLGFGWAADSLKDPKLALVPWLELAGRDVGDSAALEARIAVPYAYVKLGAYGQALDKYNDAIAAFDQESKALRESIAALRSPKWIEVMIDANPGDEMGWFWRLGDLPEVPHATHLSQVLAQHEFQEAFKNYRDLRYLAKNLDDWKSRLGAFDDMLATRKKAFADKLPPASSCWPSAARPSPTRSPRAKRPATASPSPTPRSSTCSSGRRPCRQRSTPPAPRPRSPSCASGFASPAASSRGSSPRSRPTASGRCRRICRRSMPSWPRSASATPRCWRRRRRSRPASSASTSASPRSGRCST